MNNLIKIGQLYRCTQLNKSLTLQITDIDVKCTPYDGRRKRVHFDILETNETGTAWYDRFLGDDCVLITNKENDNESIYPTLIPYAFT